MELNLRLVSLAGEVTFGPLQQFSLTFLGSKYFSLCFAEHIPEVVDLVIIELGVSNRSPRVQLNAESKRSTMSCQYLLIYHQATIVADQTRLLRNRDSYDKLLRALLDLPNKPATIYLELVASTPFLVPY